MFDISFLSISGIKKRYKGSKVPCLNGIDLELEKGEILVLLGPSGCGKTTLLKIIAGLENQDEGSIEVDGECMDGVATEKRPISMVFQKPYLFRNMTVFQNISFAPRINGRFSSKEEMRDETQKYIDLVKLTGFEERSATQLSGGQEQRVSLARALILKPKLLLLDEPLSALDANLRVEMRVAIRDICKQLGQTVIFVTHDQEEATAIGDKVALISEGRIVQCSAPNEYFQCPMTKTVARFFGWRNFIECDYDGNGKVDSILGRFDVPDCDLKPGRKVLTVRPESFIQMDGGGLECTVEQASYLGMRVDYILKIGEQSIFVSLDTKEIRRPGETINVSVKDDAVWVVDDEPDPEPTISEDEKKGIKGLFSKIRKR